MSMILFINCCVRKDSRTKRLADACLKLLGGEYDEIRLEDVSFPVVNEEFLSRRDALIAGKKFDDGLFELARRFASADTIVIAAPYYDLSFPASLKQFFEQINVVGITFKYTPEGIPQGLCRAKDIYYVMTAGAPFVSEEYGYGYVRALAENYYGIENTHLISALGLDIYGADPDKIVNEAIDNLKL